MDVRSYVLMKRNILYVNARRAFFYTRTQIERFWRGSWGNVGATLLLSSCLSAKHELRSSVGKTDKCQRSPGSNGVFLSTKKHVHNKPIAVLKNTTQNEAYMTPIQYIREKVSTSYDIPSRIGTLPACMTDGEKREPAFLIA